MTQPDSGSRRITPDPSHDSSHDGSRIDTTDTAIHRVDGPTDRALHSPPPIRDTAPEKTVYTPPPAPVATRPASLDPEVRPSRPAKTSAAAVFALVFGVAALFCALTALLSPAAILFGIIGLILAFVGLKMAKRPGVTGRGVAIGGLVTALLGLILGGVVIGGLTAVVNNKSQLDRVQRYVDDARTKLPSTTDVRNSVNDVTGN